jgi:hypothetical protein
MNDDGMLIFVVFLFLDMKPRFFWLLYMHFNAVTVSLLDFNIQSIPRLIDKIVPILDKQPNLVIRSPRILARKIQMHRHHR